MYIRTLPQNISYYCRLRFSSFEFDLNLSLSFLHNITQPFPHDVIRRVADVDTKAQAVSAVRLLGGAAAVVVVLVVVEDEREARGRGRHSRLAPIERRGLLFFGKGRNSNDDR